MKWLSITQLINEVKQDLTSFWVFPGIFASILLTGVFLQTANSPVHLGGFFFSGAETIANNQYILPLKIQHYTEEGLPFAYPPLQIYLTAFIVHGLGVSMERTALLLPAIYFIIIQPPVFIFFQELAESEVIAGASSVAFILPPVSQRIALNSAAPVYSGALFWTILAAYSGLKFFKSESRHWLVAAACTWGLVLLSHPTKTAWVAVSYLFLWAWFSRSLRGLVGGAVISAGGILLASPWWTIVIYQHGIDPFLHATSTHGGLFPLQITIDYFQVRFQSTAWVGIGLLGATWLTVSARPAPVIWILVTAAVIPIGEPTLLASVLAGAGAVWVARTSTAIIKNFSRKWASWPHKRRFLNEQQTSTMILLLILLISLPAAVSSTVAVANNQPIEPEEKSGFDWVASNTEAEAKFFIVGRQEQDWFPAYTNRTVVATPYGAEWVPGGQARQYQLRRELLQCDSVTCISWVNDTQDLRLDYIYIAKGHTNSDITKSARTSSEWSVVYDQDGVTVIGRKNSIYYK